MVVGVDDSSIQTRLTAEVNWPRVPTAT